MAERRPITYPSDEFTSMLDALKKGLQQPSPTPGWETFIPAVNALAIRQKGHKGSVEIDFASVRDLVPSYFSDEATADSVRSTLRTAWPAHERAGDKIDGVDGTSYDPGRDPDGRGAA